MNPNTKQAIDEFEKRLQSEKELLFECETEPGFFEEFQLTFSHFLEQIKCLLQLL